MRRREFLSLTGGVVALPFAARAQQRLPVVGFLSTGSPDKFAHLVAAFRQGLSEAGYVAGKNVVIEYRWANRHNEQWPALAADLVGRQVTVIVTPGSTPATLAAKATTTTIPIVFSIGGDPVELGLVANLNRPGGNLTGVTSLNIQLGPKRLQLLHELIPTATTVALLVNPTNPNVKAILKSLQAAASKLGLKLHVLNASTEKEIEAVFATLAQLQAHALVIGPNPFFNSQIKQLAALSVRHGIPAIYQYREFATAGGLMSYGGIVADRYRQAGIYAGYVLQGEKPADLPVQRATKVELFINLKTAKALGVTIPLSLIGRADGVIE